MNAARSLSMTALLGALALPGCAVLPAPAPLLAYPGPGRTAETAQQDDIACQAEADAAATRAAAPTGGTAVTPAPATGQAQAAAPVSPEELYFACMRARGNVVAPAPTQAAYPVYPGPYAYGAYYPYGGYDPYSPFYGAYGPYPFAFGLGLGFYGGRYYGRPYGYGYRGYYGRGRFGGPGYGFRGRHRR